MARMVPLARTLGVLAALILTTLPRPAAAQQTAIPQGEAHASVALIAGQLGVKLPERGDDALPLGGSFTGTLEQPDKLAPIGIRGMHAGARVSVTRIAPDRFRVEADEIQPVEARGAATVRLTGGGTLIPVAKS